MAKQRSVFDVTLEEKAVTGTPGMLDQLQLPPDLITFLQRNQRIIWRVVIVAAAAVVVVALYDSYRAYSLNKAAEAYDQALLLDDGQKKTAALQKLAEDYGTAPAGIWSNIALAHLDQEAGKSKDALAKLVAVDGALSTKDPLKPLLLANIGGLYEQEKQFDKAEAVYNQLKGIKGFDALALSSLGRMYEAQGRKEQAVQMYQQYMGQIELGNEGKKGAAPAQLSPEQEIVQASLNRLLK